MAHRIEVIEGSYVVIDLDTGNRAAGSSDYQQKHFAEEFVRKAKDESAPVVRARDGDGHFVGDDPATPENEAWAGGKPPTTKAAGSWAKAKKKAAPKKKASKKKASKK